MEDKKKYIRLDHFQKFMELLNNRDRNYDWSDEYEKYDKKVKNTIEWLERNAKTFEEGK